MKGGEIRNRFDQLFSLRKTLDETFQYIERYVIPFRGDFFKPLTSELEVEWRRRQIYDSTAPVAANLLASSIHGNLTSAAVRWFNLTFRDPKLNKDQVAREWLEECANRLYHALLDSDFNLEVAECYLDLVTYGTSILIEEVEDETEWQGLDFTAMPIRDTYFEPDKKGGILRLYRRIQYTKLQIIDKFGELPDTLKIEDDDSDVDTKHDIIFCVYERKNKKDADVTRPLAKKERPFGYKYILHSSGEELGEEGGYYEMPAFVVRWQKVAGSRWGYSPAFVVLSDILQLNEVVKQTSESRAKVIDPATITTERGIIGDLDLNAGGLTVVQDMTQIAPYESSARFDQAEAEIMRLQASVRSTYFVDKLELKDSPAMTATEVRVRYERMQRLMGPPLGRLQSDLLDPLIMRTFMILLRAGELPDAPDIVQEQEMDIEYTGPLPRSQKSETADSIEMWLGSVAAMAELFPEMADLPDTDAAGRQLALLRGVPAVVMRSTEEVEAMREERREQEQTMRALAMAEQAGAAGQSLAEGEAGLRAVAE